MIREVINKLKNEGLSSVTNGFFHFGLLINLIFKITYILKLQIF